jgi:hypothetical protein
MWHRSMLHARTPRGLVALGLAVTPDVVEQAEHLVHEAYVVRGYRDGPRARRTTPATRRVVFVARAGDTVIGTLSLLRDSARGLPADALYAPGLAALRAHGRRLAEVSAFAVAPAWRGAALTLVRPLVQLVGIYARDVERAHELCITVHPRHAAFYERRLGFVRFGGEKPYGAVNGSPAVGLRLDLGRPPIRGALSGCLFGDTDVARIRAALETDLRRQTATAGPLVQIFQFPLLSRRVGARADLEVC